MAGAKKNPEENGTLDMDTLQQNCNALELEKKMLSDQKARLEQEKKDTQLKLDEAKAEIEALKQEKANLETEVNSLKENQPSGEADETIQQELEALKKERDNALQEKNEAETKAKKAEQEASKLQEQYNTSLENIKALQSEEKGLVLEPFVRDYLAKLAEKLSKRYKKEVTPAQIVSDYIIRYNLTDRWTEWFHPWEMTEEDAIAVMQNIVPEIKTMKQLKQALHIA